MPCPRSLGGPTSWLARGDVWAVTDLLVAQPVGGPVELHEIEAARLVTRGATGGDHVLAGLERLCRDADVGELVAVVHLEPPRRTGRFCAARRRHDQHGMRIDELELDDATVDRDLPAAVVDARDRVVRERGDRRRERDQPRTGAKPAHLPPPSPPTRAVVSRTGFAAINVFSSAAVSVCGSAFWRRNGSL